MGKVKLEFISPTRLNELKDGENVNKEIWLYDGVENGELTLDTDNWTIACEANGESKSISQWLVNEDTYTMKIDNSEGTTEGYKELTYQFAVSMIGQLCNAKDLVGYLVSLQDVFNVGRKQEDSNDINRKAE